MNRRLAHSYLDEIGEPIRLLPQYRHTWRDHARDVVTILAEVVVLGTLFIGVPFLLFLAGPAPVVTP